MVPVCIHILAEFHECDREQLQHVAAIRDIVEQAVSETNLTVLQLHFHQFSPDGVTGYALLAESHISIHTWPEHCFATVDVCTCGTEEDAERAFSKIRDGLKPGRVSIERRIRQ